MIQSEDPRRIAEREAVRAEAFAAISRAVLIWNKVHDPKKAHLNAGEHSMAVISAAVAVAAEQAGELCRLNPGAEHHVFKQQLLAEFNAIFDLTLNPPVIIDQRAL